jgi:hypothetical protein
MSHSASSIKYLSKILGLANFAWAHLELKILLPQPSE